MSGEELERLATIEAKIDGINRRLDEGNGKLGNHDAWIQGHDLRQARDAGFRSGFTWIVGAVVTIASLAGAAGSDLIFG